MTHAPKSAKKSALLLDNAPAMSDNQGRWDVGFGSAQPAAWFLPHQAAIFLRVGRDSVARRKCARVRNFVISGTRPSGGLRACCPRVAPEL